ncbi:MAG: hypothetical protein NZ606_04125 [Candidatus Kapabacteria bacterium]|nr:hypothetical protein [Candidatus Kapabacteria bacterium]
MDYFDPYEEIHARVEQFRAKHGTLPRALVVSPSLYQWLCDCRKEQLEHPTGEDLRWFDTPYGKIRLVIDERLDPYEILTE